MKNRKKSIIIAAVIVVALAMLSPLAAYGSGWFTARINVEPIGDGFTEILPEQIPLSESFPLEIESAPLDLNEVEISDELKFYIHFFAGNGDFKTANDIVAGLDIQTP